jgi:hypothetical protein
MLRLLKQKACGSFHDENEETIIQTSAQRTSILDSPPSQPAVIVSHVPISVGSRNMPSSTTSSLSSIEGCATDASCCMVDNGVVSNTPTPILPRVVKDSQNESRHVVGASPQNKTYDNDGPSPSKTKNVRKISVDESTTPQAKKARIEKGPLHSEARPIAPTPSNIVLLARNEDDAMLNPLHVFVRKQLEVFTATPAELAQPAPGRKNPIKLGQVGLRCIHCRHLPVRKRVKRAVCYPSSVGRVYHSVSDFKFDHMTSCRELPEDVLVQFEALKAEGKRGSEKKSSDKGSLSHSSSTARYYHDTAIQMGMVNGQGSIFMASPSQYQSSARFVQLPSNQRASPAGSVKSSLPANMLLPTQRGPPLANRHHLLLSALTKSGALSSTISTSASPPSEGRIPLKLASLEDNEYLNDLHCFVRKHLEVFTADEGDIAAPAPGRKTRVLHGQVGVRCVHCAKLPMKERVKRAVCYPPSVGGIYHAVSNMKHDHFAICRGLPADAREQFSKLKNTCARRGTSGNGGVRGLASSTAQYYHDSAVRMGLVDTETGIRFCSVKKLEDNQFTRLPARPPTGLSALMMAASQAA